MKVLELKVVRKREYVLFATEVILYNKREVTKLQYLLLMIAQYRRREGALLLEVGREERTKLRSRYWPSSFGIKVKEDMIFILQTTLFANGLDDNINY